MFWSQVTRSKGKNPGAESKTGQVKVQVAETKLPDLKGNPRVEFKKQAGSGLGSEIRCQVAKSKGKSTSWSLGTEPSRVRSQDSQRAQEQKDFIIIY